MQETLQSQILFIGGLHRSGTTPLVQLLGSSSNVSVFRNTGAIEDEGQFLQSVFPLDGAFGGPGRLALHPDSHLTEESPLVAKAQQELFAQWCRYWDLSRLLLVEKTPAHLIQSRFLQAVFPNAKFLFIIRHPVPVSLATAKWCGAYISDLIKHYVKAHNILLEDLPHLLQAKVIFYEQLVKSPEKILERLQHFLELDLRCDLGLIRWGCSRRYFVAFWTGNYHLRGRPPVKRLLKRLFNAASAPLLILRYERSVRRFGYSFLRPTPFAPNAFEPWAITL